MLSIYLSIIEDSKEQDKFEYIYLHFRKQMLNYANQLLNNPYDSEDVVHNTFIDIAKSMYLFDKRSDKEICSYLMCATRGHVYNFMRKSKNETEALSSLKYILPIYDDSVEIISEYDMLVEAIRNLDELYSDVLYLHYVEQLTDREISVLLGRKPSTIRTQIVRGKIKLQEYLNERGCSNE